MKMEIRRTKYELSVSNCRETKRSPQYCGRDRRGQETGRLYGGERLYGELVYRHLVSLADAGTYDERFKKWRYDDLPILPQQWQYIIPDDKKKQFDTLRSLMERPDVTGLVCATDAGREGELIFRFVYQMAGCKKPFQRLWISSMEDAAIKDGFAHLKPGTDYDNLYQSALCRAQADCWWGSTRQDFSPSSTTRP